MSDTVCIIFINCISRQIHLIKTGGKYLYLQYSTLNTNILMFFLNNYLVRVVSIYATSPL